MHFITFNIKKFRLKCIIKYEQTFKIVSSEALPNRLRDWGESANDDAAFDDEEDGSVCELLLLNLCGNVLDFSHLSFSPSWLFF